MYPSLNPGCLGIQLPWEQCLPIAKSAGFEGMEVNLDPAVPAARYRDAFSKHGLRVGAQMIEPRFRESDEAYRKQIAELPTRSAHAAEVGVMRFFTWILPFSDTLTYRENFRFHVDRLAPVARALGEVGGRFGLEFIGPKTTRDSHRHPFVHTIEQTLELCEAIGENVGLLLDSWHWHTSLGTLNDICGLSAEQVVFVHVNDAPPGVPIEKQMDLVRCVPGETGVEDLAGFFEALVAIGYDGPVVAEPFCKDLETMSPQAAAERVARGLAKVWPKSQPS